MNRLKFYVDGSKRKAKKSLSGRYTEVLLYIDIIVVVIVVVVVVVYSQTASHC